MDKVDKIFDDWKNKFLPKEPLWDFFGLHPKNIFDPSIIIEKYKGDPMKKMKKMAMGIEHNENEDDDIPINTENPCETIISIDFPSFLVICKNLAEAMGYRVINQVAKVDKSAYAEGKGTDMLCTEKFNQNIRVLFCVRRWRDQIGNLTITDLLSSMRNFQANRIILVSTSGLSTEATMAIEGRSIMDFYRCEDVAQYLI